MQAEFEDVANKKWVITEDPWNFDRNFVLPKEFDATQQACSFLLTEALFWARIHDLPKMARNKYVGILIGNSIRRLEEVDMEPGEVA